MKHNIVEILSTVSGGTFIGLDTLTAVSLKGGKSNPMKGRVTKRTIGSRVMIFTNQSNNAYDNMVKRRLEQEGKDPESFTLSPRKWGIRIPRTPFVHHEKVGVNKYYLEVIFLEGGKSEYLLDGEQIDKNDVIGLETSDNIVSSNVQAGLENQVVIRTYDISSLIAIRANKNEYIGEFYFSS